MIPLLPKDFPGSAVLAPIGTTLIFLLALGILGLGLNITVSTQSMGEKVKDIRRIIRQERYRKAYKNLPLNYFPIHWKLFYGCARHGFAFGVYVLLTVIQRIISR